MFLSYIFISCRMLFSTAGWMRPDMDEMMSWKCGSMRGRVGSLRVRMKVSIPLECTSCVKKCISKPSSTFSSICLAATNCWLSLSPPW
ncbi:unnamed protein product [Ixodes pacificus]